MTPTATVTTAHCLDCGWTETGPTWAAAHRSAERHTRTERHTTAVTTVPRVAS